MGVSGQRHAPVALYPPPPGERAPVPIVQEAGWAPEPVWTQRVEEKYSRLCRGSNLDRRVAQPVVRHYTAWATPAAMVYMQLNERKSKLRTYAKTCLGSYLQ
jgi:hypothetical protein